MNKLVNCDPITALKNLWLEHEKECGWCNVDYPDQCLTGSRLYHDWQDAWIEAMEQSAP